MAGQEKGNIMIEDFNIHEYFDKLDEKDKRDRPLIAGKYKKLSDMPTEELLGHIYEYYGNLRRMSTELKINLNTLNSRIHSSPDRDMYHEHLAIARQNFHDVSRDHWQKLVEREYEPAVMLAAKMLPENQVKQVVQVESEMGFAMLEMNPDDGDE